MTLHTKEIVPQKRDRSTVLSHKTVKVVISGYQQSDSKSNDKPGFSCTLQLPVDTKLSDLGSAIQKQRSDIDLGDHPGVTAYGRSVRNVWLDVFTSAVEVTTGVTCYDQSKGLKIGHHEPIAEFLDSAAPNHIETTIVAGSRRSNLNPLNSVSSESISVGRHGNTELRISLHRTVRVPEDSNKHHLPPGLGTFPLFPVGPFRHRLPASVVAQGGLFLPIYRKPPLEIFSASVSRIYTEMEAMWVEFECLERHKFIVRPFVGGVNAITGESHVECLGSKPPHTRKTTSLQDYLVLPEQPWIDGVATSTGLVRQFVATETTARRWTETARAQEAKPQDTSGRASKGVHIAGDTPIGGSVEWQVTGQDSVGGLQLQIIPEYEPRRFAVSSAKDTIQDLSQSKQMISYTNPASPLARDLDPSKTPAALGVHPGDMIHFKDLARRKAGRSKTLEDLLLECNTEFKSCGFLELQVEPRCATKVIVKTLTGKTIPVWISLSQSVLDLKLQIKDKEGIPINIQLLKFARETLSDDFQLSDYNISKESTIHLVLTLSGSGRPSVFVEYENKQYEFDIIRKGETIGDVKLQITELLGIPPSRQTLWYDGEQVSNSRVALELDGKTLQLSVVESDGVEKLSVGAGGRIIQRIEPDTNDPRIWDVANSKIISIHLIDARSFTQVTNMPAPHSPITSRMYEKMGLPFFKLWNEEVKEAAIAGNWTPLRGVEQVARMNVRAEDQKMAGDGATHPQRWGLLRSGVWGNLDAEEEQIEAEKSEPDLDATDVPTSTRFPVVLLDVDDRVPAFRSVNAKEED